MDTQTIFRAGNSNVVAIPKHILREVGFKTGQKVVVQPTDDGVVIKKAKINNKSMVKSYSSKITPEFQAWMDGFLKKYGSTLKALARV